MSRECTSRNSGCSEDVRGFTLIELIVAMALSMVVLGAAVMVMSESFANADKTARVLDSGTSAAHAMELLQADVRAAQSPDRSDSARLDMLRGYYTPNGFVRSTSAQRQYATVASRDLLRAWFTLQRNHIQATEIPFDSRDIIAAGPTSLWLRADVESLPGAVSSECVGYYVSDAGALVREVRSDWRTCSGTTRTMTMLSKPPDGHSSIRIFSYEMTLPGAAGDCAHTAAPAGTVDTGMLAAIDNVTVDLNAWSVRGGTVGEQALVTTIAVRSRRNDAYRYALGCDLSYPVAPSTSPESTRGRRPVRDDDEIDSRGGRRPTREPIDERTRRNTS